VVLSEETPSVGAVKPTFGKLQFRHGSSARYDSDFAKDQPWVKIRGKSKPHVSLVLIRKTLFCLTAGTLLTRHCPVCSEFVDELPELDEIYLANPKARVAPTPETATPPQSRHAASVTSPAGSVAVASIGSDEPTFETSWTPRSLPTPTQVTPTFKRRRTNDSDRVSFASVGQPSPVLSRYGKGPMFDDSSPARGEDAIDSLLRAADFSEQGPGQSPSLSKVQASPFAASPDAGGVWPHANIQEACLMRYFIDELACWVCPSN
jgi:hypothetical protein